MKWAFWRKNCDGTGHDCQDILKSVYEYINQHDLTTEKAQEIKKHLDDCRGCWDRYEFEKVLIEKFRASGACDCPDSLKKRIRSLLDLY